jgi:6-phosphogluconolactonase
MLRDLAQEDVPWKGAHVVQVDERGDPVLDVKNADVALTGIYQNRRRMTLTYPIIDRSRRVLWLATGAEKAGMLARLQAGDVSIPAARVSRDRAMILADRAAAGQVAKESKAEVA